MGKIRLKTLGDDSVEKKQALEAQKRREVKKEKKGEDIVELVAVSTEKAEKAMKAEKAPEVEMTDSATEMSDTIEKPSKKDMKKSGKSGKARSIGKNTLAARKKVDQSKKYALTEAIKLVRSLSFAKFDETVELHLNLKEQGIKGEVVLPHGTGKEVRVAIADEKLLKAIDAGTFDFDVLITSPAFMPKLVPYARILGPKGLMPNPKKGTVSENPEEAAKKFKGGNVHFKTEAKAPLIHQALGKLSFTDAQLVENAKAMVAAVQPKNILSGYISGTMTPSVQIEIS